MINRFLTRHLPLTGHVDEQTWTALEENTKKYWFKESQEAKIYIEIEI